MQQVIVFGKESYNTLGVIRGLGEHGVSVFLLMHKTSSLIQYCGLSKYVSAEKKVNSVEDGVRYLIKEYPASMEEKTVIIPTGDHVASELDKHYKELSERYWFSNAKGHLAEIMDKKIMTQCAAKAGLPVPQTVAYTCGETLPEGVVFPCIIKPAKSIAGSKEEMRVCKSYDELRIAVSVFEKNHKVLLQQYISQEYEVLLLGSRCPDGKVFLGGVFKKQRWFLQWNAGSFGLITANYNQWFDKNKVEAFLEKLDYVGPFSIECGVEKNVPYFYEINLRNDGTSHYFDSLGFCNAYAWAMECMGKTVDNHGNGEYWFIDEFGDILNVLAGNVSFKQWRKDMKRASAFKFTNAKDRRPMWVIRPYMWAFVVKNALKVKRNKK